jgi:hypothetical protein
LNTYNNISRELKAWFSSNPIFRVLLPIDMILLSVSLVILLLDNVFAIDFGNFIFTVVFWIFISGLLLAYANQHNMYLYVSLFSYAAIQVLFLIINIFRTHGFSWFALFAAAISAWFGYVALKYSNYAGSGDYYK